MKNLKLEIPRYGSVPGLPDKAMTISNTERIKASCALKYWYSEIERLRPIREAIRLSYGKAWHRWLETRNNWFRLFDSPLPVGMEVICQWCSGERDFNCAHCSGTGLGPLALSTNLWQEDVSNGKMTTEEADTLTLTFLRAIEGHIKVYGRDPYQEWKVVAVEVEIAAPIVGPTGSTYCPETFIVETQDGYRLAGTGEAPNSKGVRWPWYQVMTLDAVLQHRKTGVLAVWEGKSSASPSTYVQGVLVDPQVAGYCWGLQQVLGEPGPFEKVPKGTRVAGYVFDVASNALQRDPKLLAPKKVQAVDAAGALVFKGKNKVYARDASGSHIMASPGFSVAKSASIPSWRFRSALGREGYSESGYTDYILHLESTVDPKLYDWIFGSVDAAGHHRYQSELYGIARTLSAWRRRAASISRSDVPYSFPRTPVCRLPGGYCDFKSVCLADGPDTRLDYEVTPGHRWQKQQSDQLSFTEASEAESSPIKEFNW